MLSPKNWKYRVALWMVVFFVLLTWTLIGQAQNARTKTFPLHKEFTARVVVCSDVSFAQAIAEDETTASFQVYAALGVCGGGTFQITYIKQISTHGEMKVYEVRINGHAGYAVTNWSHEAT